MNRGGLPKDHDLTEARAKRKHDQLIAMGGRPKRPVQLQPSWNAIYRHGSIYLYDHEGELEGTLSDDEDPMNRHWQNELANFKAEISLWERFRSHQQKLLGLDRLDTELELDHTNAELVKVLTRLSDWEEFEVFWNHQNVNALMFERVGHSYFLDKMEPEALGEESSPSSEGHRNIRIGLRQFNRSQKEVRSTKAWLNWIKGEWPKLVAESIDDLSKTPDLQPVLEARFRKQTHATFSAIQELGGQPSHVVSPPDESMDFLHRVLHWSSETAIYKKELGEWRIFLEWRGHQTANKSTMERKGGQRPHFRPALEFFGEFEKFRRCQYNRALSWVKCWRRIVRWYEEEIEMPNPDYEQYTPHDLQKYAEVARSRVTESEQKLADAARQLEKSAQEHARALSEYVSFSDGETRVEGQQGAFPPIPPPSNSECSRTSRSSSSTCSDSSLSSRSPHSSQSSLSSQSSQSSQSAEPPSKDRNPRMQISSLDKAERRSKKKDTRKLGAKIANHDTNIEQQAAPSFSPGPQQIITDDDIEMTDASEDPGALDRAEIEDTDMIDPHDALSCNALFSSESRSRPSTKIESKKSPISSGNGVASRKTRSVSKTDHALSGRTPKNVGKKPTKKAKTFTEQQAIILLDAASNNSSALESPPLRRSDRLKEKASSSAVTPPSHPNPAPSLQSPEQMQPKRESAKIKSSGPLRKKKPKTQPNALEPLQDSTQKKSKIPSNSNDQSRSRRQKKLEKRARSTVRPGLKISAFASGHRFDIPR